MDQCPRGARIVHHVLWEVWAGLDSGAFLLKSVNEQGRVSMWLLDGWKLVASSVTDAWTRRGCISVHEQAAACLGVNSHILRSLNSSSEVTTPGHKALHRGISCPASCCTQFHFSCFCVSYSFKHLSVVRLSSCSHIVAKFETIINSVSPFLPVKKRWNLICTNYLTKWDAQHENDQVQIKMK